VIIGLEHGPKKSETKGMEVKVFICFGIDFSYPSFKVSNISKYADVQNIRNIFDCFGDILHIDFYPKYSPFAVSRVSFI
jgi:hypothetical protein